ncbi:MAG: hypothetical protein EZS28_000036 [Streblomastix strix]|uniref:Uncharacterized protein n=1 Tax=Streblomastix strix TaxID=222440 RepID=A0A5J4XD15_9EUKA|nr:MAG: hypothetical protein EZS28_000036 [Streblomastix strix]
MHFSFDFFVWRLGLLSDTLPSADKSKLSVKFGTAQPIVVQPPFRKGFSCRFTLQSEDDLQNMKQTNIICTLLFNENDGTYQPVSVSGVPAKSIFDQLENWRLFNIIFTSISGEILAKLDVSFKVSQLNSKGERITSYSPPKHDVVKSNNKRQHNQEDSEQSNEEPQNKIRRKHIFDWEENENINREENADNRARKVSNFKEEVDQQDQQYNYYVIAKKKHANKVKKRPQSASQNLRNQNSSINRKVKMSEDLCDWIDGAAVEKPQPVAQKWIHDYKLKRPSTAVEDEREARMNRIKERRKKEIDEQNPSDEVWKRLWQPIEQHKRQKEDELNRTKKQRDKIAKKVAKVNYIEQSRQKRMERIIKKRKEKLDEEHPSEENWERLQKKCQEDVNRKIEQQKKEKQEKEIAEERERKLQEEIEQKEGKAKDDQERKRIRREIMQREVEKQFRSTPVNMEKEQWKRLVGVMEEHKKQREEAKKQQELEDLRYQREIEKVRQWGIDRALGPNPKLANRPKSAQ